MTINCLLCQFRNSFLVSLNKLFQLAKIKIIIQKKKWVFINLVPRVFCLDPWDLSPLQRLPYGYPNKTWQNNNPAQGSWHRCYDLKERYGSLDGLDVAIDGVMIFRYFCRNHISFVKLSYLETPHLGPLKLNRRPGCLLGHK